MRGAAEWPHRLRLTLRDGRTLEGFSPTPPGGADAPTAVEVKVVAHPDLPPLGVGECAAGPTAAAIANALYDALGLRARHLPLTSHRLLQLIAAS